MKIEILGCYGNINGPYRATSFLINDTVLLDAGTVSEVLDDERLKKISRVLITHTHLDHVKGLFPLVDELFMWGDGRTITVVAVRQVLDMISTHLFNNVVWPDFTAIPSRDLAVLQTSELTLEEESEHDGIAIRPIQMQHTVFTTGFLLRQNGKGFMFTADTGPTERFWEIAREEKGIEFVIADVSFPNRLADLAGLSCHGTLGGLTKSLDRYGLSDMRIYISHIKPIFREEILEELKALNRYNIRELEQGSIIKF